MEPDVLMLRNIADTILDSPDEITITRSIDDNGVLLLIEVPRTQAGRLIGKEGSTAKSMRTILRALGTKTNAHYSLKVNVVEL